MLSRVPVLALLASASVLLTPAAASACKGDCDCDHAAPAAAPAAVDAMPATPATPEPAVTAKCNCEGPADCTCKKGECKCKKCKKDGHQNHGAGSEKRSGLLPPLKGAVNSPELPASAPLDASAGLFI